MTEPSQEQVTIAILTEALIYLATEVDSREESLDFSIIRSSIKAMVNLSQHPNSLSCRVAGVETTAKFPFSTISNSVDFIHQALKENKGVKVIKRSRNSCNYTEQIQEIFIELNILFGEAEEGIEFSVKGDSENSVAMFYLKHRYEKRNVLEYSFLVSASRALLLLNHFLLQKDSLPGDRQEKLDFVWTNLKAVKDR